MQKSSYPEKITVKVQNTSQHPPASKKSVFQRLGSKSGKLAGTVSLEEQCKELRRQIKMEGSAKKRATKRHKESSSSSDDSSSGSSSDSSSSSSSSQSSSARRKAKKTRKGHHHSSSSVDHLAAKIRKTSSAQHRPHAAVKSLSSSASKLTTKKHKTSRLVESPPLPRRRSASTSPGPRSRKHLLLESKELKKRDSHRRSKEPTSKDSLRSDRIREPDTHNTPRLQQQQQQHDSRGRSRSPRDRRDAVKRRLTPLDTGKRQSQPQHSSPMRGSGGGGSRSLTRNRERSVDRDRERREKDREEREIARNKEREEALMRCQERQRERDRLARERERKGTRSREKSLDRDKSSTSLRLHSSGDRRSAGGVVGRGGVDLLHDTPRTASSRGGYSDRRGSPTAEGYDYERSAGDSYRDVRRSVHRDSGNRDNYEKEYNRGPPVPMDRRSPYEEVGTPRSSIAHEKYRGSGGFEYEHVAGRSEGRLSYGEVRVRGEWEEEKMKVRDVVPRDRILDRVIEPRAKEWIGGIGGGGGGGPFRGDGLKEWGTGGGGGGNKWDSQKYSTPGSQNREEMWPREGKDGGGGNTSWRNNSYNEEGSWQDQQQQQQQQQHSTPGGGGNNQQQQGGSHFNYNNHHNQHGHHHGPAPPQQQHHQGGPPQQQQQQQQGPPPHQQQTPRMMGRYNENWRPRFGQKKEFFRHQFNNQGQHDGPGSEHRFSNQKRFGGGGDYHQQGNFVPRGMMNQGPKFNTPVHAQHQQEHSQLPVTPQPSVVVPEQSNPGPSPVKVPVTAIPTPPAVIAAVPPSAKIEDVGTPTEDEKKTVREALGGDELQEGDNLSEFSDDGDEILDKELDEEMRLQQERAALALNDPLPVVAEENVIKSESETAVVNEDEEKNDKEGGAEVEKVEPGEAEDLANQDDLTLDFEEISDGELEEESAKVKGLGDALGVDWAGLIAEQRVEKRSATDSTVKEMWEPKRIFRDVGISVRMAGAELAQRLLGEEVRVRIKTEPMDEERLNGGLMDVKGNVVVEDDKKGEVNVLENPVASCQVALRKRMEMRASLIVNKNGPGGSQVALCARRDLQIRRQLCGLPAWEIQLGGGGGGSRVTEQQQKEQEAELRTLAMEMFTKATAVH